MAQSKQKTHEKIRYLVEKVARESTTSEEFVQNLEELVHDVKNTVKLPYLKAIISYCARTGNIDGAEYFSGEGITYFNSKRAPKLAEAIKTHLEKTMKRHTTPQDKSFMGEVFKPYEHSDLEAVIKYGSIKGRSL